jgi:serine phosphatase RsbU (regulator of sigma subunit)
LNILSVDLLSRSVVISRNNPSPVYLYENGQLRVLENESIPLGLYRDTRPLINELGLHPELMVVAYTDGLVHAGKRRGTPMDMATTLGSLLPENGALPPAQAIADELLKVALELDDRRPSDDMSVIVLQVREHSSSSIRRMLVQLPIA